MTFRAAGLLLPLLFPLHPATAVPAGAPAEGSLWTVTLADGTRLAGVPEVERLELVGTLVARAELAPAHLASLRLDSNGETATVLGRDGERIVGAVRNDVLTLDTALGRFALPFEHVRCVLAEGCEEPPLVTLGDAPLGRFGERADGFEPGDVRVDFETDPAGRPLAVGDDLSATFALWGLRLATSVQDSFPAVDAYTVGSPSRGHSCATRQPRWTGTLTLGFCEPGRPDRVATVTRVRLWVAAVSPGGTRLRALGLRGEVLAETVTTKSGSELLTVRSERPIASVQVIPNPDVDPNYTIDDVAFDPPRPLGAPAEPAPYTVLFRTGDVVAAQEVELDGAEVVLSGLSLGVERLRVPRAQVASIRFPGAARAGDELADMRLR